MTAQARSGEPRALLRSVWPLVGAAVAGLLVGAGAFAASRNGMSLQAFVAVLGGLAVLTLALVRPRAVLYGLILLLPVETIGPLSLMQSKVIKLAVMLLLLGIEVARRCVRHDARWRRSPYDGFILAFLASATLSTVLSRDPLGSARSVVQSALIFGFFALIVNRVEGSRTLVRLIYAMIGVAAFVTVYGILQKEFGYDLFGSAYIRQKIITYYEIIGRRLFSVLNNPNALGGYLGTLFPIALAVLLLGKVRWYWRAALAVLLALMGLVMLWAGSRGALMGVAAAAGVLLLLLRRNRAFVVLLAIIVVLPLAAVLYTYEQEALARYLRIYDSLDVTLAGRWEIWRTAVAIARDHWPAGIGFYTWTSTYPEYGLSFWKTVDNPHNLLLNMAVEQGLLGVVLYLWFVVLFLASSLRYAKAARRSPWAYPILVGILGAGISRIGHEIFEADTLLGVSSVAEVFWALLALQTVAVREVRREQTAVAETGGEA